MKETKEMLEIIHNNRNKVYQENVKANIKKEKKQRNIKAIIICIAALTLLGILAYNFNEKQVKNCMEDGYSETFCRYAGE